MSHLRRCLIAGRNMKLLRVRVRGAKLVAVIAGLVPAISIRRALCLDYRDGRDKPGHDRVGTATSFAPVNSIGPKYRCRLRDSNPRPRDYKSSGGCSGRISTDREALIYRHFRTMVVMPPQ